MHVLYAQAAMVYLVACSTPANTPVRPLFLSTFLSSLYLILYDVQYVVCVQVV